jgi:hypothetical protein
MNPLSAAILTGVADDCKRHWRKLPGCQTTKGRRLRVMTFRAYSTREYDSFRVEAFRKGGSRFPVEDRTAQVVLRAAAG